EFPFFPGLKDASVDLTLSDLAIIDTTAGNLSLLLKTEAGKLKVDASLANEKNKIRLHGLADPSGASTALDLRAEINLENLHALEHYSFGSLSKMSGRV